jgi:hypothetical protein
MTSNTGFQNVPGGWEWPDGLHQSRRGPSNEKADEADTPAEPVREDPGEEPHIPANPTIPPEAGSQKKEKHWKPRTCRICFDTVLPTYHPPTEDLPGIFQSAPHVTYESEDGRLIRPCKCKGSSKYVHENCLQAWRHADASYGRRNYYQCPTCLFKYNLSRISWGRFIGSVGAQITLTVTIFLFSMFILGFIADPIIDFCLDPYGFLFPFFGTHSTPIYVNEDDSTWLAHFTKGFASLGMISFVKVMFASPVRVLFRGTGLGGTGRATGRDRITGITWVVILAGAATFVYVSCQYWPTVAHLLTCRRWYTKPCAHGVEGFWRVPANG